MLCTMPFIAVYSVRRDDQLPEATDVRHMALGDKRGLIINY